MLSVQKERFKSYKVVVNFDLHIAEMIQLCNLDWFNPDINAKNFSIRGVGKKTVNLVLVSGKKVIEYLISQDEAKRSQNWVNRIHVKEYMDSHGLGIEPIAYLLALGAEFPDLQRKNTIVSLDSSFVYNNGHPGHPCLYCSDNGWGRKLGLGWDDGSSHWGSNHQFLAVHN